LRKKLAAFNQARQGSADTICAVIDPKGPAFARKPVKSPISAPSTSGSPWSAARTTWRCCTQSAPDPRIVEARRRRWR